MFEQTILAGTVKTRRAWTVPVCFAGQLAFVGCLALVPLIFFEGLPQGQLAPPRLTVPGTYRPPTPPHVQLVSTGPQTVSHTLVQPVSTPHGIHLGPDLPAAPPDPVPECTGVCVFNSVGPADPVPTSRLRLIAPEPQQPEVVGPIARATPTPAPIRVACRTAPAPPRARRPCSPRPTPRSRARSLPGSPCATRRPSARRTRR